MLSALILTQRGYPAVQLALQPVNQRLVRPGPLVLRTDLRKLPAPRRPFPGILTSAASSGTINVLTQVDVPAQAGDFSAPEQSRISPFFRGRARLGISKVSGSPQGGRTVPFLFLCPEPEIIFRKGARGPGPADPAPRTTST